MVAVVAFCFCRRLVDRADIEVGLEVLVAAVGSRVAAVDSEVAVRQVIGKQVRVVGSTLRPARATT